jgi:predicted metal-dependent HD superfamily phosphohydrolase
MTTYRSASDQDIERLRDIWTRATAGRNAEVAAGIFQDLLCRYGEPHRVYHNAGHLVEVFEHWSRDKACFLKPDEVALALFFHDAVYEIGPGDNEERSAVLAYEQLGQLGFDGKTRVRVADLIRMTATHDCAEKDLDAKRMLDIDMAVLGQEEGAYDRYAAAIVSEYASVFPEVAVHRGRLEQFLKSVLAKGRIFLTQDYRDEYEAAALANLAREQRALELRLA